MKILCIKDAFADKLRTIRFIKGKKYFAQHPNGADISKDKIYLYTRSEISLCDSINFDYFVKYFDAERYINPTNGACGRKIQ